MGDSAVSAALNALNNSLKDANLSLWRDGWQIDTKGFNLRTDSALSSRFEGLIDNLVAAIKDAEAPKYAPFKEELEQTVQFKEKTGNYTATLMVSGKPMTISARSTSMSGISSLEQNSAIENLRAEAQKLGFKDPSRLTFVQVY